MTTWFPGLAGAARCDYPLRVPRRLRQFVVSAAVLTSTAATVAQSRRFAVSAADGTAHHLSPIGFSVDLARTTLAGRAFPEPGRYASFSGPPGGPTWIRIEPSGGRITDDVLPELVDEHARLWGSPMTRGAPATVMLDDDSRAAMTATTGTSIQTTQWCVVLVPAHTMRRPMGLLVAFGLGSATPLTCAQILAHPPFAAFARTFRVE